jgi:hypothetical protein
MMLGVLQPLVSACRARDLRYATAIIGPFDSSFELVQVLGCFVKLGGGGSWWDASELDSEVKSMASEVAVVAAMFELSPKKYEA